MKSYLYLTKQINRGFVDSTHLWDLNIRTCSQTGLDLSNERHRETVPKQLFHTDIYEPVELHPLPSGDIRFDTSSYPSPHTKHCDGSKDSIEWMIVSGG